MEENIFIESKPDLPSEASAKYILEGPKSFGAEIVSCPWGERKGKGGGPPISPGLNFVRKLTRRI